MGIISEKRGDRMLGPLVIFILLSLMFFILFSAFVIVSASGGIVLEQTYAKEIALFLDNGRPGVETKIDIKDGLKIFGNKVLKKIKNQNF